MHLDNSFSLLKWETFNILNPQRPTCNTVTVCSCYQGRAYSRVPREFRRGTLYVSDERELSGDAPCRRHDAAAPAVGRDRRGSAGADVKPED